MKVKKSHKKIGTVIAATFLSLIIITGACDELIRDNLLILEDVAEFVFTVDTGEVNYSEMESVNLQSIIDDLDSDVEDVRFYNITIQVTNTYNTPVATSISGSLRIKASNDNQYRTLVNFTDLTLEEFQTERSIFSDELDGITVVSNGVDFLMDLYGRRPAPTLDFNVQGSIDRVSGGGGNVEFDFTARVYSQFETDP